MERSSNAVSKRVRCSASGSLTECVFKVYLRVYKVSLVIIKPSPADITVEQGLLQEVASVQLVPRVFNLKQITGVRTQTDV